MVAWFLAFSTVRFQMCPQTACLGCICLDFQVCPQTFVWEDALSQYLHLCEFSLLSLLFKWFNNIYIWEDALSHWLRLFGFYLLCMFKWLPKLPGCREAKLHEQNQRGVKPHWNICNKQFISNSGLKKHLPRHCGESSHWNRFFGTRYFSCLCLQMAPGLEYLSIFGFGQTISACGFVGIFPPPRKDTIANVKDARKYSQGKVKVLKFAVILAHKLVLACWCVQTSSLTPCFC